MGRAFWCIKRAGLGLTLASVFAIGTALSTAPAAYATYSPSGAASYADQWATSRNPNFNAFDPNDCANFVSQAMHIGGNYSFDNPGGATYDDHNWYYLRWGCGKGICQSWTRSWTVVSDLDTFLYYDYPGGYDWGSYYGAQYGYRSGVQTGDLIFFDFGDGAGESHAAIQVLTGNYYDPNSGWVGDEVDAHTNDRYHAYWDLTPYNPNASTTTTYIEHIDPNND